MESKLHGSKIKLKLEQPGLMCGGREKVECWYRGKVVINALNPDYRTIIIKSHGKEINVVFYKDKCISKGWEDLKVVK